METKDLIITKPVFNAEVLHGGVAIRLEGETAEGIDLTGNYIIYGNTGEALSLTGCSFGEAKPFRLFIDDIESGLTLEILAGVEHGQRNT